MTVRLDSRVNSLRVLKTSSGTAALGDDALDGAGAVAEDGEEEFARGSEVVEPAAEGGRFGLRGRRGRRLWRWVR